MSKNNRFKSSITLPGTLLKLWARFSKTIETNPTGNLPIISTGKPRRENLRHYTRGSGPCIKVNVYWEIGAYNRIHALAAALRVSVSWLICQILQKMAKEEKTQQKFSTYSFSVHNWTDREFHFSEKISIFSEKPPP